MDAWVDAWVDAWMDARMGGVGWGGVGWDGIDTRKRDIKNAGQNKHWRIVLRLREGARSRWIDGDSLLGLSSGGAQEPQDPRKYFLWSFRGGGGLM